MINIAKKSQYLIMPLFLIFLLMVEVQFASASSYYTSATRIGKQDGLPETTIFSLAVDQHGFLWLGAPNSLIRYDGYEFKQFSQNNSDNYHLHVSGAGNLFVDSQNRLWIGAWGDGLAVYDQSMNLIHHFRHYANDGSSLPDDKVQVIFEDDKGDIWVGTNGGGLAVYQPRSRDFVRYLHNENNPRSLSHNRVWAISQNQPGVLWIATSNGLNRLDLNVTNRANATFQRFTAADDVGFNHSLIRSLYSDKNGRLWVGTQGEFGWFDIETKKFHAIDLPNETGNTIINRIKEDHQGNILVATQQGLYHYLTDKKALSPWSGNKDYQLFPQRDIRDIMVDSSGLLWLTTRFAGLIKIDLGSTSIQPFAKYVTNNSDVDINRVYEAVNDDQNRLWLSSSSGLLYKDQHDRVFSRFQLPSQLNDKNILAMTIKDQNLWLGGHFGLYSFNRRTNNLANQTHLLDKVENKQIHSLLIDSSNNLWIGTIHNGLIKYGKDSKITHYIHRRHEKNSISGNTIVSLLEDNHGHIWIGTGSSGLNRLDVQTNKITRYYVGKNGLRSNTINDVYQSHNGDIWLTPDVPPKYNLPSVVLATTPGKN